MNPLKIVLGLLPKSKPTPPKKLKDNAAPGVLSQVGSYLGGKADLALNGKGNIEKLAKKLTTGKVKDEDAISYMHDGMREFFTIPELMMYLADGYSKWNTNKNIPLSFVEIKPGSYFNTFVLKDANDNIYTFNNNGECLDDPAFKLTWLLEYKFTSSSMNAYNSTLRARTNEHQYALCSMRILTSDTANPRKI